MPILLIIVFILGFGAGAILVSKRKAKAAQDVEDSLKKAFVLPTTAPPPQPNQSDLDQRIVADTMEKKILYEEQLSLIFRMGQEMFSNISMENTAKIIAENANKIVNADICTFMMEDKATAEYVPVYSQGVKREFIEKMRFKKGESITGWVAANNEALVKNDIEGDSWFKSQNKGEYFVGSVVSIPLLAKDQVIAVLNLSNKKNRQPFSDQDLAFLRGLTTQASIILQNITLYEQVQENYLRTITALAFALDARDSYTRAHSENVTRYAVAIAREMNFRPQEIDRIRRAGLLHDIGKIGIRDGVLLKPSKLTDEEYDDIKNHPGKGETIVSALPFLKEEAKMIRHHHERFDGKGYPDGISGETIEKGARILAVADSFDAMVENRIYRKALTVQAACQELKNNSGKQFDPEAVDAVLRILEKNPGLLASEGKSATQK